MTAATFEARYPGWCPAGCGQPIEVKDEVKWDLLPGEPDLPGNSRVVHAGCSMADTQDGAAGEVCPRCWTEKSRSGACACEEE